LKALARFSFIVGLALALVGCSPAARDGSTAVGAGEEAVSTTDPTAVAEDFPGPSNTGIPPGVTLEPSGTVVVTEPGVVIDGLDITGMLQIEADGVTVRNTRIRSDNWVAVYISGRNTVIEDCEIDGLGLAGWPDGGAIAIAGTDYEMRRCNIHHVGDGASFAGGQNVVIEDNWLHDFEAPGEIHYDGVQLSGPDSNIVIRHNTISVPSQTGAVNIGNTFGPITDVTVEGNLVEGGTYTVYVDGKFSDEPMTGIRVVNNRFGAHTFDYALIREATLVASHGNVDHASGRPIRLG
jgi:hypothetical protein